MTKIIYPEVGLAGREITRPTDVTGVQWAERRSVLDPPLAAHHIIVKLDRADLGSRYIRDVVLCEWMRRKQNFAASFPVLVSHGP